MSLKLSPILERLFYEYRTFSDAILHILGSLKLLKVLGWIKNTLVLKPEEFCPSSRSRITSRAQTRTAGRSDGFSGGAEGGGGVTCG